jgi:hypothetical protein
MADARHSGGTTTSHTIMVEPLGRLLAAVPADAPHEAYVSAVVEDNILGKATLGGRKRTLRYLRELYLLRPEGLRPPPGATVPNGAADAACAGGVGIVRRVLPPHHGAPPVGSGKGPLPLKLAMTDPSTPMPPVLLRSGNTDVPLARGGWSGRTTSVLHVDTRPREGL